MIFGGNTSHTWHVNLSRCKPMELGCKHANIMSLYEFLGNHIPNRER